MILTAKDFLGLGGKKEVELITVCLPQDFWPNKSEKCQNPEMEMFNIFIIN